MNDNRTRIHDCDRLDAAYEGQQGSGMIGNPVVGPRGKLELTNFPLLHIITLQQLRNIIRLMHSVCSRKSIDLIKYFTVKYWISHAGLVFFGIESKKITLRSELINSV